jgi:hypothetical protein
MINFSEIKNRDAWSTIRGYVYQVDLTIDRWLSLKENQILELEKGEDIDLVSKDLTGREFSRILEQVKYRESTVSLNQQTVLEILKNYYHHRVNNPGSQLFFRFVTNAEYNIERPAIFESGESGIEVWQQLSIEREIADDDQRLISIQNHLIKKVADQIEPEDDRTSQETKRLNEEWEKFKDFIGDARELHQFMTEFEWSTGTPDEIMISDAVKSRLIGQKLARIDNVEIVYARLFLFVFKILTVRDVKVLTKSNLLDQVKLPPLLPEDEEFHNSIKSVLYAISERLSKVENQFEVTAERLADLAKEVGEIRTVDAVFSYQLSTISVNPPGSINRGCARKGKVGEIVDLFNTHSWVYLQGINGTGKTQLAVLVSEKYRNRFWLDLRAFSKDEEKSMLLIEAFLSGIAGCPLQSDRRLWLKKLVTMFPKEALIVINDLPELKLGSRLGNLLALLTRELKECIKLLTTSNYGIGSTVKDELQLPVCVYDKLEFSDDEINEYLLNQGADESVIAYVSLIAAASHRNPRLLSAVIFRLKQINWGKDTNALFDVIFQREFSDEVLQDAQKSIKKYIEDDETKELLYRLSLIHWEFRLQDVQAVSQVERKVRHPKEKLSDLINIWIQQNSTSYLMSPLVYDIGESNLEDGVKKQVYKALAQSILANKELNQITASRCIHGFVKAGCYDDAGAVLLMLYRSAETKEQIHELKTWGYLSYWSEFEIPLQMNVVTRAFIRSEQIRLHRTLESDVSFFVSSLISYIYEPPDAGESAIIRIVALMSGASENFAHYAEHVLFVVRNLSELPEAYKRAFDPQLFSGLLWVPIQQLHSFQEIKDWLELISFVDKEQQMLIYRDEIAQDAIAIVCNKIAVQDSVSPLEKIEQLDMIIQHFYTLGYEELSATALSFMTAIMLNLLGDQERAESVVSYYSTTFQSEEAKYILSQNFGKLLFNAGFKERSSRWLLIAASKNLVNKIDFIDTLIYAASVVSESDPKKAIGLCEQAVQVAAESNTLTNLDYIKALGELGIAYWKNEEWAKGYHTFERSVNKLLELENHSEPEWVRIFSWTGHVLGYLSASVARDKVPQLTADGTEYTKPYQGIITVNTKDLSDHFRPEHVSLILVHLAIYADGLNKVQDAYTWSQKAFDRARRDGNERIIYMVSFVCAQYALINYKLNETFESYLLGASVASHLKGSPQEKYKQLNESTLSAIIGSKPSEDWNVAEETTINFAIIPLFVMVLTRSLENHPEEQKSTKEFLLMIRDYIPKASNVFYWEIVYELFTRILYRKVSVNELTERANTFGQKEQKTLQIICLLGVIFLSKEATTVIEQVLNIFPYLSKVQTSSRSVIKFALIPFVKIISKDAVQKTYIGSRSELNDLLTQIDSVDITEQHAIQLILQPAALQSGINIKTDRKAWLFEYKDI